MRLGKFTQISKSPTVVGLTRVAISVPQSVNVDIDWSSCVSSRKDGRGVMSPSSRGVVNTADASLIALRPRPHQPQCRSNIVECYKSNYSLDNVETNSTSITLLPKTENEATFDFVERTKFYDKLVRHWGRSFTASERSRAVPSRIKPFFFYVRAIRFAFF